MDTKTKIQTHLSNSALVYQSMIDTCWRPIQQAAMALVDTYYKRGGRFLPAAMVVRPPMPSISATS